MPSALYICMGEPDQLEVIRSAAETGGVENWTINKKAALHDRVVFYLTGPLASFVAVGTVASVPRLDDGDKGWAGHYMANIKDFRMLPSPLHIRVAKKWFPQWRWLTQNRRSTAVPPDVADQFLALLWIVDNERTPPGQVTLEEVQNILRRLSLSKLEDVRHTPDNRRRGQFKAGWEDFTVRGDEYRETTLGQLTWHNLGYRFGKEVGSSTDDINTYYDHLVHLWANPGLFEDLDGPDVDEPRASDPPDRRLSTVNRVIRDTAMTRKIKAMHDHRCQVCGCRLETPGGAYAEGAHIRPLGSPHNGHDREDNILCLCPNHHVLFDGLAFTIADDLTLIGMEGRLRSVSGHSLNHSFLAHHRERYSEVRRR